MPVIIYQCSNGHVLKNLVRSVKNIPASLECKTCKEPMKRSLSAPSSTNVIVIDNGLQAKAVEINPNIVEMRDEKANKNLRED